MIKKDLKLDKYGISKYEYRELKYFCLRYPEMKKRMNESLLLQSTAMNGMPKGNNISNPTANKAEIYSMMKECIEMIEQTAIKTDSGIYQYLLKNVTYGINYEYLKPPCGRNQFYAHRRKFFYLLNIAKNGYKSTVESC